VEITGNNYTRNDWRNLLSTRRGTVLVAAVCAIVAAGILVVAINRYRSNVDSSGDQETVLVASGEIQKGMAGDAIAGGQLFKSTSVAAKQVSAGAIADTTQLRGEVAATTIYPGQQLTAADFTANGGLPAKLAPNQRAMTVTVDSSHGMIGQVVEGDRVDVYADLEPSTGRSGSFVRLLMADTPVLKAPSSAGGGGLAGNQQSNVTLQVDDNQAGALAFAADNGKLWLVLRPANATATPPETVSVQSIQSTRTTGGGK